MPSFNPFFLEELAKKLGFVKRKRKFSGSELATIFIWISQRTASDSLVRLCSQLHAATGTLMSPEGLNKRFDKKAVEFLKYIFLHYGKVNFVKHRLFQARRLPTFNVFVF